MAASVLKPFAGENLFLSQQNINFLSFTGRVTGLHQKEYSHLIVNSLLFRPKNFRFFELSDQGSNLDSSEPKSDVLPVTPSDNPKS
jgi:hypothetical protein